MEVEDTRVLLLSDGSDGGGWLHRSLLVAGATIVAESFFADAAEELEAHAPDLVTAFAGAPDARLVGELREIRQAHDLPIAAFFDEASPAALGELARGIVSLCVVGRPDAARFASGLVIAVERFEHEQELRRELDRARRSLADRKTIDRAKGILMDRHGLAEKQAYQALRRMAMNEGIRMAEAARRLIAIDDVVA